MFSPIIGNELVKLIVPAIEKVMLFGPAFKLAWLIA
jgi:hypothetical protein